MVLLNAVRCLLVKCFSLFLNTCIKLSVPDSVPLSRYLPEHIDNRVFSKQGIKLLLLGSILKTGQSYTYGRQRPLYFFHGDEAVLFQFHLLKSDCVFQCPNLLIIEFHDL